MRLILAALTAGVAPGILAALTTLSTPAPASAAGIYRWDTGTLIPGTAAVTPGPGVYLGAWDTSTHNLRFANLAALDLHGANFNYSWLDSAHFTGANLTSANLSETNLTSADLTGTQVTHADFGFVTGFTAAQLISTASYQNRDLSGICLPPINLAQENFASQNLTSAHLTSDNLTNASFLGAVLVGADFGKARIDLADLRRATGFNGAGAASTRGMIRPDGTVSGFALIGGETWLIRPDSLAVAVDGAVNVVTGSEVKIDGSAVGIQSGKSANWTLASGGKVTLLNNALLRVSGLQLAGTPGAWTSKIDVNDNKMIIDNANSAVAATTYANTVNQITTGSNFDPINGVFQWDGQGITSSKTNTEQNVNGNPVMLGVLNNDDGTGAPAFYFDGVTDLGGFTLPQFAGQNVNGTDVLVKFTWYGDADLSGTVDSVDFALFRAGFLGGTPGGWMFGDFDYNGTINSVDFALFWAGFLGQTPGGPLNAAPGFDGGSGPSAVPEPGSLALLGLGGLLMLKRRNRKS